jgi:hypothetical protein
MEKIRQSLLLVIGLSCSVAACKKVSDATNDSTPSAGSVTGKVTDTKNNPVEGAKVTIEHTVWYNTYVFATSNSKGSYKTELPADPAGDWTAKAQLERTAYGKTYKFDLDPDNTDPFNRNNQVVRNFTWKLNGKRPGDNGYYGAHVDVYQWGIDVEMDKVKLILTPYPGETLIDGSPATTIERTVEDVAGTFMVKDVPIGKYYVRAEYPGKSLLLQNRHDETPPAAEQTVVFGKNGYLADTEYNIEFWLTE